MNVTAIWLRRIGLDVQVLAEVDGQWRLIINEQWHGNISHIVEENGIANPLLDLSGSDMEMSA